MPKKFQYKADRELQKKRDISDRGLFRAKCRFLKWDLAIRLGRMPTQEEIVGVALCHPLTILEVHERIRDFKRARLAKRRNEEVGEPVNEWDKLHSPFQKRQTIDEEDVSLHLQYLRDGSLVKNPESAS